MPLEEQKLKVALNTKNQNHQKVKREDVFFYLAYHKLQYPLIAMSFDKSEYNLVFVIFLQSLISIYQAVAEKSICFVFDQP
jgi:hypothetical protein